MTQDEHLEWAKQKALALLDKGEPTQACVGFIYDLRAHPDLKNHVGLKPTFVMAVMGDRTVQAARRWISGFR